MNVSSLKRQLLFIFLLSFFFMNHANSQVTLKDYLPADVSYDANIPTPYDFFKFHPGEWHIRHDVLVNYLKTLAQKSDRVTIEQYGSSYEQRPLLLMSISSADNIQNMENIRKQHIDFANPDISVPKSLENMPVFVWQGYSVHGNEASGSNAVPLVAYYLAAAQGPEIEKMLKNTVILVDPCINPDGFSRFTIWANMHKGQNLIADRYHREHREAWPGGRTNHYWFDLNRDWLLLQHPESRSRIIQYHKWLPHIVTDFHEMGSNSTYFFQPGVPSRNNPLTPATTTRLTEKIAEFHAKALDNIGSLYFSKENFDDYYYGKGSTYPDVNGSIGILFEQASVRGHLQETVNGTISFPFAIRNQVTTSFSTLEAAQALRKELINHQRDFYKSAMQQADKSKIKTYVFGSTNDPVRNYHFIRILLQHKINVFKLNKPLKANNHLYKPGSAYIVPVEQPQFRLLTTLFETRTHFHDSLFYDISSWTLPLAFNLPYAELDSKSLPNNIIGESVINAEFPKGHLTGDKHAYAYAFEWNGYYAPRALYRLMQAGIKTKIATSPFRANTASGLHSFDYGTILVSAAFKNNKTKIDQLMDDIIQKDGIHVFSLLTGMTPDGIDFGSPKMKNLKKPHIMLLVGNGVSSTQAGEVWHLLDERMSIHTSLIENRFINSIDISGYTTIIMPRGNYNAIDSTGVSSLKQWIKKGGTLVTLGSASKWLVKNKLADIKYIKATNKESPVMRRPYAGKSNYSGAQAISGAIFKANLDITHPIGYGFQDSQISLFHRGTQFIQPSQDPYATPLQYDNKPLQSGYISKENERLIAQSAATIVSRLGKGRIISMMFNPNFRAVWYGTNKLFLNSLFFGQIIY